MSKVATTMVEYIATTQPQLEKLASERKSFLATLQSKLNSMVKAGAMLSKDAENILKEAEVNPANALNYLDLPAYSKQIGNVTKTAKSVTDPLSAFSFQGRI